MEEVISEIIEIRNALKEREIDAWPPNYLSRAMTKLALLNMTLGTLVVEAAKRHADAELLRKVTVAKEELRLAKSMPMTQARAKAEVETKALKEAEGNAEYEFKLAQVQYRDIGTLISVLQSRLRGLDSERYQQSNNLEPESI